MRNANVITCVYAHHSDLPDAIFRRLKIRARVSGTSLKDLLTRYVERGLREPEPLEPRGRRSPLPVILPHQGLPIRALTNQDLLDANVWVACAVAIGRMPIRLVPFDGGFGRFDELAWLHLEQNQRRYSPLRVMAYGFS